MKIEQFYNKEGKVDINALETACKQSGVYFGSYKNPTKEANVGLINVGENFYYLKSCRQKNPKALMSRAELEVLHSKMAKRVGMESADYYIGVLDTDSEVLKYFQNRPYGIDMFPRIDILVSSDVRNDREYKFIPASAIMDNEEEKRKRGRREEDYLTSNSIRGYKEVEKMYPNYSFQSSFYQDLMKLSLFDFATGQMDRHPNNYFLKLQKGTNNIIGTKAIDYEVTCLNIHESLDFDVYMQNRHKIMEENKHSILFNYLGIEGQLRNRGKYIEDLCTSDLVNINEVQTFLERLKNESYSDIVREVEEAGYKFSYQGLGTILDDYKNSNIESIQEGLAYHWREEKGIDLWEQEIVSV